MNKLKPLKSNFIEMTNQKKREKWQRKDGSIGLNPKVSTEDWNINLIDNFDNGHVSRKWHF